MITLPSRNYNYYHFFFFILSFMLFVVVEKAGVSAIEKGNELSEKKCQQINVLLSLAFFI